MTARAADSEITNLVHDIVFFACVTFQEGGYYNPDDLPGFERLKSF